ncbi:hypothetical protein C0J52_02278 [Blattella germanica]|nr:hypothetical protein C0J52_02278 [Blattella germanica]
MQDIQPATYLKNLFARFFAGRSENGKSSGRCFARFFVLFAAEQNQELGAIVLTLVDLHDVRRHNQVGHDLRSCPFQHFVIFIHVILYFRYASFFDDSVSHGVVSARQVAQGQKRFKILESVAIQV